MTPDISKPADLVKFFRNVQSGEPFDGLPSSNSLDYSLQMTGGVAAAIANGAKVAHVQIDPEKATKIEYFITSMHDRDSLPNRTIKDAPIEKARTPNFRLGKLFWVFGILTAVVIGVFIYLRTKK